jgi:hypothetical protein
MDEHKDRTIREEIAQLRAEVRAAATKPTTPAQEEEFLRQAAGQAVLAAIDSAKGEGR